MDINRISARRKKKTIQSLPVVVSCFWRVHLHYRLGFRKRQSARRLRLNSGIRFQFYFVLRRGRLSRRWKVFWIRLRLHPKFCTQRFHHSIKLMLNLNVTFRTGGLQYVVSGMKISAMDVRWLFGWYRSKYWLEAFNEGESYIIKHNELRWTL